MFDVELYKGRPALKLPYNAGDDPQTAARDFLQQNDVDERFLETVTDYIRSQSQTGRRRRDAVPPAATAASTVSDKSTGRSPLSRRQTIDKVGQVLWAWFSFVRKSADEIVEP